LAIKVKNYKFFFQKVGSVIILTKWLS
jgi:hypothetical protein